MDESKTIEDLKQILDESKSRKPVRISSDNNILHTPSVDKGRKTYEDMEEVKDIDIEEHVADDTWDPEIGILQRSKIIEYFISSELKCPVCGEKELYFYENNSMPVADLVCRSDNISHNSHSRFFQVKTKHRIDSNYFSKTNQTIHTGSIRYGKVIHDITDTDKSYAINYICICLVVPGDGSSPQIENGESFILLPNISENGPFYYYPNPIERKVKWYSNKNTLVEDFSIMFDDHDDTSLWEFKDGNYELKFNDMYGRLDTVNQVRVGENIQRRSERIKDINDDNWLKELYMRAVDNLEEKRAEMDEIKEREEEYLQRLIPSSPPPSPLSPPPSPSSPSKKKRGRKDDNEEDDSPPHKRPPLSLMENSIPIEDDNGNLVSNGSKQPISDGGEQLGGAKYYREYKICLKKYMNIKLK